MMEVAQQTTKQHVDELAQKKTATE